MVVSDLSPFEPSCCTITVGGSPLPKRISVKGVEHDFESWFFVLVNLSTTDKGAQSAQKGEGPTNTKSLAKEFSKILIFEYFGYLRKGFDVFFDADSESPRMT